MRISVMEKKRGKNDHNINEHEKDERRVVVVVVPSPPHVYAVVDGAY